MLNFLAIGPPKSGTTLLQNILIQNTGIYLSPKKEIQFFNHNFEKGYQWYDNHFKNATAQQIVGEISPTYCDSFKTLSRIKEYADLNSDDIKIIITIRDPLKRLISEYYHNIKRANYNMPINEAIKIELENKETDQFYTIVRNSRYFEIVSDVYKLFNKEKVLIINSDEELFNKDAIKNTIKKIEDFLEIKNKDDYNFDVDDNASYVPKSYTIQKVIFHNQPLKRIFKLIVPSFKLRNKIRSVIKKFNTKKGGYETHYTVSKEEAELIYNSYLKADFESFTNYYKR